MPPHGRREDAGNFLRRKLRFSDSPIKGLAKADEPSPAESLESYRRPCPRDSFFAGWTLGQEILHDPDLGLLGIRAHRRKGDALPIGMDA